MNASSKAAQHVFGVQKTWYIRAAIRGARSDCSDDARTQMHAAEKSDCNCVTHETSISNRDDSCATHNVRSDGDGPTMVWDDNTLGSFDVTTPRLALLVFSAWCVQGGSERIAAVGAVSIRDIFYNHGVDGVGRGSLRLLALRAPPPNMSSSSKNVDEGVVVLAHFFWH